MALKALTIYSSRGQILGWWYGETFSLPESHQIRLIPEDPGIRQSPAVASAELVVWDLLVIRVNLRRPDGGQNMHFCVAQEHLDEKFWVLKEAIKFEGKLKA